MKTLLKSLALVAMVVGVVAVVQTIGPVAPGAATDPGVAIGWLGLAVMGIQIPVRARTESELLLMTKPQQGQLEAVPWKYFDTQTITSGTTKTLNFFTQVQNDPTMGNLEQAGTIQAPNYFELYSIRCDFLGVVTNANAAVTGLLNDIAVILNTQRATYQLTRNSKSYGVVPLAAAHGLGGPVGLLYGTTAANQVAEFANNSVPDDGDWWGGVWLNPFTGQQEQCGSVVLPPTQSFALQVNMAAAPTLSGNINVRMTMAGVLHRAVL